MARSTGIVLAAGALTLTDLALTGWDPGAAIKAAAATVGAAFLSAALDKVASGFGTGLAVLLLLAVVLKNGPSIAARLFPAEQHFGPK